MKTTPVFPCFQNTDCPCFGQNTGCVLNIRVLCFEITPLRSMAYTKTQNTNRTMAKTNLCFEIRSFNSRGYVKTQNTDFLTLRGRCPPRSRRERHHLPRGRLVSPDLSSRAVQTTGDHLMNTIDPTLTKPGPALATPTQTLGAILALDLGTTTGWAMQGHGGLITSGTVSFRRGVLMAGACVT